MQKFPFVQAQQLYCPTSMGVVHLYCKSVQAPLSSKIISCYEDAQCTKTNKSNIWQQSCILHSWNAFLLAGRNSTNPILKQLFLDRFVPAQRWLHNIEHGAIVMLYHPCTHHTLVEKLRSLVKGCIRYVHRQDTSFISLYCAQPFIRKHIISPSTLVSETRPLVLVGWGCRLEMGEVDEQEVPS